MAPWSAEWEERHALIYELSEENAMAPLSDEYKQQLGKLQLKHTEMTRQLALITSALEQAGDDWHKQLKAR
ncbi:hypothetical protein AMTR_s00177p00065460 [Amborella trichopoda]|uniref:Uncharacterized protein n=1 Tax=Amborella trichopoda TaxID=13333 RepID=W1PSS9_AMBTC|nr:hypothetical protein AMTR_s00177p00065460 [Amborella trichopoda]